MNMLSGNTFGCPIDESLKERDLWGEVYECGWESITGKLTSPVEDAGYKWAYELKSGLKAVKDVKALVKSNDAAFLFRLIQSGQQLYDKHHGEPTLSCFQKAVCFY